MTRVSLIIAAHNEGDCLCETVRSCVVAAKGVSHEIIIADDASDDGSVEATQKSFPNTRIVRHETRKGASPTKSLGAQHARGDVLLFLDGHCCPERGAIDRLVEDVELLDGSAVVTPAVPALDTDRWQNDASQIGHGYHVDLQNFECNWRPLSSLRQVREQGREFYESPALIGCALAVSRDLYEELWGFDRHMFNWGIEDLDFGLKCWLMGYRILHDPAATVGHRFRESFDNYEVPAEHLLANQLRMARKQFTQGVWSNWVNHCQKTHQSQPVGPDMEHPEGLWARAWQIFEQQRESVEEERSYLMSQRTRDEFWYADRFGLDWPRLQSEHNVPATPPIPAPAVNAEPQNAQPQMLQEPQPSPPPCNLTGVTPEEVVVCINTNQQFTAEGSGLEEVDWSTSPAGSPATGSGSAFTTQWSAPGTKTVTANCEESSKQATATVVQVDKVQYNDPDTGWTDTPSTMFVLKGTTVAFKAIKDPTSANWPSGKPVWGGSSGASGTEETTQVAFNTTSVDGNDYKTVTAECGNNVTVDVVVFELEGTLTPQDNFQGRSQTRYGIMELVDLDFSTSPEGITAAQAGGLKWKLISDPEVGIITGSNNEGTGKYNAGSNNSTGSDDPKFLLDILAGPSKGMGPTYSRQIILPQGGYCVQRANSNIWHCQNTYSIGLNTDFFLLFKDVSFRNLTFKEGTCPAQANGWYDEIPKFKNFVHDAWPQWFKIGDGNIDTGCQVLIEVEDTTFGDVAFLFLFNPPEYDPGVFIWDIPWLYSTDGGDTEYEIAAIRQKFSINDNGTAKVEKGGAGPFQNNHSNPSQALGGGNPASWPVPCPPN